MSHEYSLGFPTEPLSKSTLTARPRTRVFTYTRIMEDIYMEWRQSLKPKQKKRTYKHFDKSLNLDNDKDFERVVYALRHIDTHQFLPLAKFVKKDIRFRRRGGIAVRSKKERPIMYASHLDAHIYGFYARAWSKKYEAFVAEKNIGDNAIAYRKIVDERRDERGKNNIAFAHEVFEHIQAVGTCSVIIADISKFFDTLNHKILKDRVAMMLGRRLSEDEYKVFRSLTAYRYVLNDSRQRKKPSVYAKLEADIKKRITRDRCSVAQALYELGRNGIIKENKTPVGIPQGSPLSGLLANMYMGTFDAEFVATFPDALYRRYSDDVAIVCSVADTEEIFAWLCAEIQRCALGINPSKVTLAACTKADDGSVVCGEIRNGDGTMLGKDFIDYLGFEFDGRTVHVRGKTLQNAYRKAHTKTRKFIERQEPDFEHKKDRDAVMRPVSIRGGAYMKNAQRVLDTVGQGIENQRKKFFGYVRKKRVGEKQK